MNKWKTISKNAISFVLGIIFATCSIVLAETCQTTLSSSNVIYEDTTVQAETTELITQADNLNTRVGSLENHFQNGSGSYFTGASGYEWLFISNTNSNSANKDRGIGIIDSNANRRSDLYFDPSSDKTILDARSAGGGLGTGVLDLRGSSVLVNGKKVFVNNFTKVELNKNSPITIAVGNYGAVIAVGFVQGIGGVTLSIVKNTSSVSVTNMNTSSSFNSAHLPITVSGGNIIISSPNSDNSYLAIMACGMGL